MAQDGLPLEISRKLRGDQLGELFRNITPHAVITRERRLRGIDIKAGAEPEIVAAGGITRDVAARTGVRRDKDQAQLGARPAKFTLLRDIGVGAGETRQIPDHRQLRLILMRRDIDRKGHAGPGLAATVLVNTLHTTMRSI